MKKETKKSMTAETRSVSYLDFAHTARSRIWNCLFSLRRCLLFCKAALVC